MCTSLAGISDYLYSFSSVEVSLQENYSKKNTFYFVTLLLSYILIVIEVRLPYHSGYSSKIKPYIFKGDGCCTLILIILLKRITLQFDFTGVVLIKGKRVLVM